METAVGDYSADVEILDSKLLSADTVEHLFDIQVKPSAMDRLIRAMRRDGDLDELEVVTSKNGHIYGAASSGRCTICKELAKSKCFLSSVSVTSREAAQWTVLGSNRSFADLVESLEEKQIAYRIRTKKELGDTDLLTTRQEQILSIAYESGYFDFPKKMGLKELAAETGVRTSTLAEILRRGQRKVLGTYLARRALLHRDLSRG
jgi:predicted DNA binding protein